MPSDQIEQPWAIRSTLIAVADLNRSVAFYGELGPFEVITREDAVAVLGNAATSSLVLILRETQDMHQARHGPQSLGLRSISFNVGSLAELDRIESVLRNHGLYADRDNIADGASQLVRGRDPDNLPLLFVCYAAETLGPDYYKAFDNLVYSVDA
jgi:catechol 2,3-dioxygenase-like lactoylglutathione lyase family enzyme